MRVELDVPPFLVMEDLSISPSSLNMSRRLYPNTLNLSSFELSTSESIPLLSPRECPVLMLFLCRRLETGGTEKQLKVALRNQGVDPDQVSDEVWWLHPTQKVYVPFTRDDWKALSEGQHRL